MLIMGAKRCVGSLGIWKCSTCVLRQQLRPPVQGSAVASSGDRRRPAEDFLRAAEMQIARLPVQ